MEMWRTVWRNGFAPEFSDFALEALREALIHDDPRLLQGTTTVPAPVQAHLDCPAEGACAIAFGGWQGDGLATVGELEEYFTRACFGADTRLGESAACRWYLNWHDDAPRGEFLREMLAEVSRELDRRVGCELIDAGSWDEDEAWSRPVAFAA